MKLLKKQHLLFYTLYIIIAQFMEIVIGVIVVALLVWVIYTYNCLVSGRNKVEEAFSTMDVCMKKRYDLIPSLVNAVKGYADYESDTLQNVVRMRQGAGSTNEKVDAEVKIGEAVKALMVQVEAYPDLKANEAFLDLQNRLAQVEEEIAFARRYYNGSVREYNNSCQQAPNNIVAGVFKFETRKMYEVSSETERKAVEVKV